jgi:hypothetical protein
VLKKVYNPISDNIGHGTQMALIASGLVSPAYEANRIADYWSKHSESSMQQVKDSVKKNTKSPGRQWASPMGWISQSTERVFSA